MNRVHSEDTFVIAAIKRLNNLLVYTIFRQTVKVFLIPEQATHCSFVKLDWNRKCRSIQRKLNKQKEQQENGAELEINNNLLVFMDCIKTIPTTLYATVNMQL